MTNEHKQEDIQGYKRSVAAGMSNEGEQAPVPIIIPAPPAGTIGRPDETTAPLFSAEEATAFRVRWETIQGSFVDEPRVAVEQADTLVGETMKRLVETFAHERENLHGQGAADEAVSTENLRLALRRYRSFFGRLLSV